MERGQVRRDDGPSPPGFYDEPRWRTLASQTSPHADRMRFRTTPGYAMSGAAQLGDGRRSPLSAILDVSSPLRWNAAAVTRRKDSKSDVKSEKTWGSDQLHLASRGKGSARRCTPIDPVSERAFPRWAVLYCIATDLHAFPPQERCAHSPRGASPVDLGWEMADARFERTEAVATVVSLGIEKRSTHYHQRLMIPSSR